MPRILVEGSDVGANWIRQNEEKLPDMSMQLRLAGAKAIGVDDSEIEVLWSIPFYANNAFPINVNIETEFHRGSAKADRQFVDQVAKHMRDAMLKVLRDVGAPSMLHTGVWVRGFAVSSFVEGWIDDTWE